jgi:hypothetical protein
LYVLALFQLLGGPLVLCGVAFFMHQATQGPVATAAFTDRVDAAIHYVRAMEHGADRAAVLPSSPDLPGRELPAPPPPKRSKETAKWLTTLPDPQVWRSPGWTATTGKPPLERRHAIITAPREGPPPPPPRWA